MSEFEEIFEETMGAAVALHRKSPDEALVLRIEAMRLAEEEKKPVQLGRATRDIAASLHRGAKSDQLDISSEPLYWANFSVDTLKKAQNLGQYTGGVSREIAASIDRRNRILMGDAFKIESSGLMDTPPQRTFQRIVDEYKSARNMTRNQTKGKIDQYEINWWSPEAIAKIFAGDVDDAKSLARFAIVNSYRSESPRTPGSTESLSTKGRIEAKAKVLYRGVSVLAIAKAMESSREDAIQKVIQNDRLF